MIKKLTWDSEFFNLQVGEYALSESEEEVCPAGFDVIYVKGQNGIENDLLGYTKTFEETKVVYSKNLQNTALDDSAIVPFDLDRFNIEVLYDLAYVSGEQSRFNLDVRFGREQFERLYRQWVDNSVNKTYADGVYVYLEQEQIIGMITYAIDDNQGKVGLLAVSKDYQGKGIGQKLVQFVEAILSEEGIKSTEIPTQLSNVGACRFYEKLGYTVKEKINIKHYWKNDTI
ncbi:MAG: GNAT family N-acetyltransferase [Flavobacteriales bacterium]|nr:GNAT family N-acetyltransferase [Flavobacteriales bacterium]